MHRRVLVVALPTGRPVVVVARAHLKLPVERSKAAGSTASKDIPPSSSRSTSWSLSPSSSSSSALVVTVVAVVVVVSASAAARRPLGACKLEESLLLRRKNLFHSHAVRARFVKFFSACGGDGRSVDGRRSTV